MPIFESTSILFFGSLFAGFLGALSGLGGGLIIVPLLVLGLHVDVHYAIGASLLAVIATSTGASVAYVKEGFSNIRIGMLLETATCLGALTGVTIGMHLHENVLLLIFGAVLMYSGISTLFSNHKPYTPIPSDKLGKFFKLSGDYPSKNGLIYYHALHVPFGYAIMYIAGILSGVLGIGSGVLKVLALDKVMHVPFKVSTTTSNFMIGVTAATSAGIYLNAGYIDPLLTAPIVLGVTFGAIFGARLLPKVKTSILRYLFATLVIIIAIESIFNGLN